MATENPTPFSYQKKRALDALERRFVVAKAELNQENQCSLLALLSSRKLLTLLIERTIRFTLSCQKLFMKAFFKDSNRRDAVERVLVDIMRKGDESGGFVSGIKKIKKENWVLLDNFLLKDDNSLANARPKSLRSHSKRSRNHMSMKQHRQCGSFNLSKEFHKKKQLTERLLTADLHGAFLSVSDSSSTVPVRSI
ncbi:hypothetical protein LUZ61_014195 [Rhynchospora tenuis]|uniref:Uncharacterized protein n=1 Tax=Rhynchospora tenuis TaxID=198213 RepID=A0AAD5WA81_9POAL|nr:hypothetical protein LUZ61_014195 [Rhynchospora tenuis]